MHHFGLDDDAALDANRNVLSRGTLLDTGVGQADDSAQRRGVFAGGDVAADVRAVEYQVAFQRLYAALGQEKPTSLRFSGWASRMSTERRPTKNGLLRLTAQPMSISAGWVMPSVS